MTLEEELAEEELAGAALVGEELVEDELAEGTNHDEWPLDHEQSDGSDSAGIAGASVDESQVPKSAESTHGVGADQADEVDAVAATPLCGAGTSLTGIVAMMFVTLASVRPIRVLRR